MPGALQKAPPVTVLTGLAAQAARSPTTQLHHTIREQLFSICCVLSAGRDPQPQLLLRGMRPQVREACTGPPGKGEGASSPGRAPAGATGSWAGGHTAAPQPNPAPASASSPGHLTGPGHPPERPSSGGGRRACSFCPDLCEPPPPAAAAPAPTPPPKPHKPASRYQSLGASRLLSLPWAAPGGAVVWTLNGLGEQPRGGGDDLEQQVIG